MAVKINNLLFPFEDYFQKHANNVLMFGQDTRDIALAHTRNWRRAVDIGAHVGISIHCWAPKFEHVVAFEPMVDHYECLKENVKQFDNVEIHNCGLSNENKIMRGAYRTGKNSGSFQLLDDSYVVNPRKKTVVYQIPSRRLDEFNLTDVDLIKIDVEGWELEVLKGAKETIKQNRPTLMVEFTGGSSSKSMKSYDVNEYYALIEELGYHAVASAGDDTIYVSND